MIFTVEAQEVLRGDTKLVIIVIIMIIKDETFSIEQYPVPNMGQVEFTYVIV